MGAYASTYIGVFLEVPIEEKEVPYKVLKNSIGKIFKSGKFDPDTGETLTEETIYKKKKIYPVPYIQDEEELEEDMFFSPEFHEGYGKIQYFLLNFKSKYSETIDENETAEFTDIDIKEVIENFKEEYSKYLSYYKRIGYNFKIKWGIVNYAH